MRYIISYIDIDKIVSVKAVSGAQQDKNNCTFHIATDGRTYELQAHDDATMNKYVIYTLWNSHSLYVSCAYRWINSLQYMKEWRAKQKREANN